MVQECAAIALRRQGPKYADPGNLYQRVVFDAKDHYRNLWRRANRVVLVPQDGIPEAGKADNSADAVSDVRAAVGRLPDRLREAVTLVHLDGWNQTEAAAKLGITQSAVARRVKRGLTLLRESLSAYRSES